MKIRLKMYYVLVQKKYSVIPATTLLNKIKMSTSLENRSLKIGPSGPKSFEHRK